MSCDYCGDALSEHSAVDHLRDFVMDSSWDGLEPEPTKYERIGNVLSIPASLAFTREEFATWLRENGRDASIATRL
jgi:hypothetical protein